MLLLVMRLLIFLEYKACIVYINMIHMVPGNSGSGGGFAIINSFVAWHVAVRYAWSNNNILD